MFGGMALVWELPALPCVFVGRLRQRAEQQMPTGCRTEQTATEITLIKAALASEKTGEQFRPSLDEA